MKVSIDHLLFMLKEHGAQRAVECVDVETIDDATIKIICRTLQNSCDELEKVLISRIVERDS